MCTVRRRRLLPFHHVPHGLPIQAAQDRFHNENLPFKHQHEPIDLLGHPEGSVAGIGHLERFEFDPTQYDLFLSL
jgi:hypothetical protein